MLYVAQVYCSLDLIVHFGLFVHQWNVRVKDLASILYVSYKTTNSSGLNLVILTNQLVHIGSEFYAVCITLLKTAILLEWVRIFVPRATRGGFFVSATDPRAQLDRTLVIKARHTVT